MTPAPSDQAAPSSPVPDSPVPDSPVPGSAPIDPEVVARLRLAMARLARRQRQAASTGLTPSQQSALAMIDIHGPIPLGELAEIEQVARPTITRIAAKLEEQALVARLIDDDDRRFVRMVITPVGHERLEETRQRRNRWLTNRIEGLVAGDVAAILAVVEPLERLLEVDRPGSDS